MTIQMGWGRWKKQYTHTQVQQAAISSKVSCICFQKYCVDEVVVISFFFFS